MAQEPKLMIMGRETERAILRPQSLVLCASAISVAARRAIAQEKGSADDLLIAHASCH